jgi:molybdenum cofactor cytidylyltransferase
VVPGAILASGSSRRMGRSKALLPAGANGPTFVRQLADTLRAGGITDVLIVGRPEDTALRAEVGALGEDVRFIENHRADDGQISSIVAAVNVVDHPGVQGLLAVPVDQPLVTSATVATLLDAYLRARPPIARATFQGRHGHPVVFAPAVFSELRRADRHIGARMVLGAHAAAILDVEVPDEGVVIDVDDREDYARVFGGPLDEG